MQRSPIRIMFPSVRDRAVAEAVVVNTAGGIAGGDRLDTGISALANASISVTSQAAERVYRALNTPARIANRLSAASSARVAWLPQETLVFNRARFARRMEIELSSGAELLALEWLVLGRAAHGEEVSAGHIADHWRVRHDGRLIWADGFRADDVSLPQMRRRALLGDCRAFGTLVYFGPRLVARLETLRELLVNLECRSAVTSVGGLIVARFAAPTSAQLRRSLRSLLTQFSAELGPGPFGVPRMWSC
jgi:urease accessory protein